MFWKASQIENIEEESSRTKNTSKSFLKIEPTPFMMQ